jgi:hypothetical protein
LASWGGQGNVILGVTRPLSSQAENLKSIDQEGRQDLKHLKLKATDRAAFITLNR